MDKDRKVPTSLPVTNQDSCSYTVQVDLKTRKEIPGTKVYYPGDSLTSDKPNF